MSDHVGQTESGAQQTNESDIKYNEPTLVTVKWALVIGAGTYVSVLVGGHLGIWKEADSWIELIWSGGVLPALAAFVCGVLPDLRKLVVRSVVVGVGTFAITALVIFVALHKYDAETNRQAAFTAAFTAFALSWISQKWPLAIPDIKGLIVAGAISLAGALAGSLSLTGDFDALLIACLGNWILVHLALLVKTVKDITAAYRGDPDDFAYELSLAARIWGLVLAGAALAGLAVHFNVLDPRFSSPGEIAAQAFACQLLVFFAAFTLVRRDEYRWSSVFVRGIGFGAVGALVTVVWLVFRVHAIDATSMLEFGLFTGCLGMIYQVAWCLYLRAPEERAWMDYGSGVIVYVVKSLALTAVAIVALLAFTVGVTAERMAEAWNDAGMSSISGLGLRHLAVFVAVLGGAMGARRVALQRGDCDFYFTIEGRAIYGLFRLIGLAWFGMPVFFLVQRYCFDRLSDKPYMTAATTASIAGGIAALAVMVALHRRVPADSDRLANWLIGSILAALAGTVAFTMYSIGKMPDQDQLFYGVVYATCAAVFVMLVKYRRRGRIKAGLLGISRATKFIGKALAFFGFLTFRLGILAASCAAMYWLWALDGHPPPEPKPGPGHSLGFAFLIGTLHAWWPLVKLGGTIMVIIMIFLALQELWTMLIALLDESPLKQDKAHGRAGKADEDTAVDYARGGPR